MKDLMPPINTPDNVFRDGNPATGVQGDIVPALWLNDVQSAVRDTQKELISVLNEAGIAINEIKNDQLLQAILKLTSTRSIPVGIPLPWPIPTPPAGWMKCNGAAFNKSAYPLLALVYTSGSLPDLRGEFIRGFDDGRGIDPGRGLMSGQQDAQQNITGTFGVNVNGIFSVGSGAFALAGAVVNSTPANEITPNTSTRTQISIDASRQVRTALETRPRNIAFNYIVRAA
jgi:hypothetical protein